MENIAIVIGGTGAVGKELVALLLNNSSFDKVIVLVRKTMGFEHPKLQQLVFDFNNEQNYLSLPKAQQMFCCLGTTIRVAGSQENFKKVDFEYPLNFAKAGKLNGVKTFHVVTALGADADSRIFYNKVKGQLQDALVLLNFENLYIYQPSLLLSNRVENRIGEKIAIFLMTNMKFLMQGSLKKYRAIQVKDVAKAMLHLSQKTTETFKIISSDEIQSLADRLRF